MTSGTPSIPLPLTQVSSSVGRVRQLTLRSRISNEEGFFSVYRGDLDGRKVVAKIAEEDGLVELLQHEGLVYQHLSSIQGSVIPTCLGLFTTGAALILITEDCGAPLESFSTLTDGERYVLFCFNFKA
jgi:hypothetical protein